MELNSSETYTWIIFSSVIFLVTGILLYMGKNYSFKFIFLYIAIVVLAICCILAYYSIEENIKQKTWPPVISKCPDYWVETTSPDGTVCENTKQIGSDSCPKEIDLTTFEYNSKLLAKNDCEKAKWARSCNLTWDGITNNEDICN